MKVWFSRYEVSLNESISITGTINKVETTTECTKIIVQCSDSDELEIWSMLQLKLEQIEFLRA